MTINCTYVTLPCYIIVYYLVEKIIRVRCERYINCARVNVMYSMKSTVNAIIKSHQTEAFYKILYFQ